MECASLPPVIPTPGGGLRAASTGQTPSSGTPCAHHLFSEHGERKITIASPRYLDTFAKIDGSWYLAEPKLLVDWSGTRPSTPGI
jgi:hypothetical protein